MATSDVVAKLLADISHIHEFLAAQQQVLGVHGIAEVLESQSRQLIARIASIANLPMNSATEVTLKVQDGPWTLVQKGQIMTAINDHLNAATLGITKEARSRSMQKMSSMNLYFTAEDISYIQDTSGHLNNKISRVVERCWKLGLELPSEDTIRHIVGVLVMVGLPSIQKDSVSMYNVLTELKRQSKMVSRANHLPNNMDYIVCYPALPKDLPIALYQHCYGDEHPVQVDVPNLSDTVCMIPLRRTSKMLLQQESHIATSATTSRSVNHQQQFGAADLGSILAQALANYMPSPSPRAARVQMVPPVAPTPMPCLTVPALQPHAVASAPIAALADQHDRSSHEIVPATGPTHSPFTFPQLSVDAQAMLALAAADQAKVNRKEGVDSTGAEHEDHVSTGGKNLSSGSVMKRPAAHKKGSSSSVKVSGKTAKHILKDSVNSSVVKKPSVPDAGSGTTFYRQGKIHRSDTGECWRVFVNKGDRVDRKIKWNGDLNTSWKKALSLIDSHSSSK